MNAATEDNSPVNQFNDCTLSADSLGTGMYIMVYRLYDFPCSFHPSILYRVSVWGKERFFWGCCKSCFLKLNSPIFLCKKLLFACKSPDFVK